MWAAVTWDTIANWPAVSKKAATDIMSKYGPPNEVIINPAPSGGHAATS
jgi:hypothetical protein